MLVVLKVFCLKLKKRITYPNKSLAGCAEGFGCFSERRTRDPLHDLLHVFSTTCGAT